MSAKVREDANQARRLGVSGTPAFLIGTVQPDGRVKVAQRLSGAQPPAAFEGILNGLVAGS
jgi:predicted DsbA family dithiol-disulfide isomerase